MDGLFQIVDDSISHDEANSVFLVELVDLSCDLLTVPIHVVQNRREFSTSIQGNPLDSVIVRHHNTLCSIHFWVVDVSV